MDCLSCRIVTGEIAATKVAESNRSFAFRDLAPTAPTHVLVVPKRHVDHAGVLTAEHAADVAEMFATAQEVAQVDGIDGPGYGLVFSVGEDSANRVSHLHMNVIGRRPMGWPPPSRPWPAWSF